MEQCKHALYVGGMVDPPRGGTRRMRPGFREPGAKALYTGHGAFTPATTCFDLALARRALWTVSLSSERVDVNVEDKRSPCPVGFD